MDAAILAAIEGMQSFQPEGGDVVPRTVNQWDHDACRRALKRGEVIRKSYNANGRLVTLLSRMKSEGHKRPTEKQGIRPSEKS